MAILKRHSSTDSDSTKTSAAARESSAVVVASLSDDMLAEIILRLPVDSVARSKCVSKAWCATVSDGYFRRRLPLQLSVVYFPDNDDDASSRGKALPRFACAGSAAGDGAGIGLLRDRDLGFFPFLDVSVVCDACNGLLLLRAAGTRRFYVVDPVTRDWAALPPPSRDPRLSMLAFDPSSGSPRRRGYHVVNFTGRWHDRGGEVEVFSSETRAWALRDAEFGVPAASLSGSVHFHAGAVYVPASDPDCVVRMDVAAAEAGGLACAVAELPEPADGGGGDGRLAHSAGRLHYVATDGALRLKVWVLDGESPAALQWRLKHAVKLGDVVELRGECGGRGSEARFLAFHPEKDAVYVWSAGKLQLLEYDLTRKEVTGAWAFGEGQKNRVVKTWLVPSSMYLSDRLPLADGAHVQQC
ncbi:unnamed protein product [Miscanthus lutarioriparius]|uniref:F-box domain-containing protein n=1 Tax=Miscanthus lutarioriparius TaxID=422564 RepID=A0A811PIV6_9POAL|nr:unnamed protein product [Miscanthus lutarioriparius]